MKHLNAIRASAMVTALCVAAPVFAAPDSQSFDGAVPTSPNDVAQPPQAQFAVAKMLAQATPVAEDTKAADAVPVAETLDKTNEVAQPAKQSAEDTSAPAPGAPPASALVASPECLAELARASAPGATDSPASKVSKLSKDCIDAAQASKSDAPSNTDTASGKTETATAMPNAPKTEADAPSSASKQATTTTKTDTDSSKSETATAMPSVPKTEADAPSSASKQATTTTKTDTDSSKSETATAMPSAPKTEADAPSSASKTATSETSTDPAKTETAAKPTATGTEAAAASSEPKSTTTTTTSETSTDSTKAETAAAKPTATGTEAAAAGSESKTATTAGESSTDPAKTETATAEPAATETETETETAAASSESKTATTAGATSTDPAKTETATAEPTATETETAAASSESKTATTAGATSTGTVSDEAIQKSVASGEDVVVADQTSVEERATIEQSQASALSAAAAVATQEPESVTEQVITAQDTRSSTEESASALSASAEKDDNSIWKLIGAGGVGAVVGALLPSLGGKLVQDQGDRVIVERDGELRVHKDENLLLRRPGVTVQTEQFAGGIVRDTVRREDGSRVVTVRDAGGRILERTRVLPDGREFVLIDDVHQRTDQPSYVEWERQLPPRRQVMPGDRYIVESSGADRGRMREALMAPPTQELGRTFTLRDVRDHERVRAFMPRVDLDEVQFAMGSAAIDRSQVRALNAVGNSMAKIIEENPREVFLIEGHTDAVGSNLMNLALSDRRAESVALALSEYFPIPPENLVVQGYGERHLKQDTQGASQANRRVTIRRITPLIAQPTAMTSQPARVIF